MKRTIKRLLVLVGIALLGVALAPSAAAQAEQPPKVQIPQPGVPEIMTMEGKFVRVAYNNEGYVVLGYQVANLSLGEEWLLLEVGMTVLDGVPNYLLKRDALSLETPDGQILPLPSIEEFRDANTRALQNRAKVQRVSINYFPPLAIRPCTMNFFQNLDDRALPREEVELSNTRACLGRLYFKIPGGIKYGPHWLNVKFEKSLVRVPFRILTKDEEKFLSKNYKDIKEQVEEAFAPKKK